MPDRNVKIAALEFKFSGWNWSKDQEVKATLRTGDFHVYSDLNWIVLDPRSLLLRSNDPEDILKLVKTTSKLCVERDGEAPVTFDIIAPGKALEALKPCRDQLKLATKNVAKAGFRPSGRDRSEGVAGRRPASSSPRGEAEAIRRDWPSDGTAPVAVQGSRLTPPPPSADQCCSVVVNPPPRIRSGRVSA